MSRNLGTASPLRYPGGKSRIAPFLSDIILLNNLENSTFYEMYAGGSGASLNLLFSGVVNEIVLNDYDEHIYYFWKSVVDFTDELLEKIHNSPINMSEWNYHRMVYENYKDYSIVEVGFSTFFLNRCNRSGILYKAGPIGGKDQTGNYKMDVRFNRINLAKRIERIASFGSKVKPRNRKSISYLPSILKRDENQFIFLDPPYYDQGENLYLNFYKHDNHIQLRNLLEKHNAKNWFLTYDNCAEINEMYEQFRKADLPMSYTLQSKRQSKEVMVFADSISIPKSLRIKKNNLPLTLRY